MSFHITLPSNTPSQSSTSTYHWIKRNGGKIGQEQYGRLQVTDPMAVGPIRIGQEVRVYENDYCWEITDEVSDSALYVYKERCSLDPTTVDPTPTPTPTSSRSYYVVQGCETENTLTAYSTSPKSMGTTWNLGGLITPGQAAEAWTIIAVSFDQSTNISLSQATTCAGGGDLMDPR